MKKYAAFAASVAISAAALVGCGGEDDFCGQAEDFGRTGEMPSGDEFQELVDTAPDDIKEDVQVVADAIEDPTSVDQAAVQDAAANIEAWGNDNCEN